MKGAIESLGRNVVGGVRFAGGSFLLLLQTVVSLPLPPIRPRRTLEQMVKIGIHSMPIATMTSFFLGVVLAFQSAYQMQKVGASMYIPSLVSISMCREIGPVLTALVVAGRVGASIAAEIGSMKVTEQLDALETLAAPPVKYLVVPRFLALFFMLPALAIWSDAIGILGGYVVSVYKLGLPHALYLKMSFLPLEPSDIVTGILKTFVFATIICITSCYEGLRVEGGAEGVGSATTRAVVRSFILIIGFDALITILFYFFA